MTDRFEVTFEIEVPDGMSRMVDWDWKALIDLDDGTDKVVWPTLRIKQVGPAAGLLIDIPELVPYEERVDHSGYPQTPEEQVFCEHGNHIWFGHECGLCE